MTKTTHPVAVSATPDFEIFSAEFLSAERQLLDWAGILRLAAKQVEKRVAGYRAFVISAKSAEAKVRT